jgi:hypothetical protein
MRRVTVLIALLALAPGQLFGQQGQQRPPRAEIEQRIRARFGEQVRRELGLTDEQLAAVQQVEASFRDQRLQLVQREAQLRRQLRRDDDARTPEQARVLLEEMAAVRADEARLFQAEMDALLQTLTADQVLRFYELRDDFLERVRRIRQGAADGPLRDGPRDGVRRGPRLVALTTPLGVG